MSPTSFRDHLLDVADRAAAEHLAGVTGHQHHDALLVLGSGLAEVTDAFGRPDATLRLSDLPGVPAPTADGHRDELRSYLVEAHDAPVRLLVALGRTHLYEGLGRRPVTALVRAAAAAGVTRAILTSANGSLQPWRLGDVVTLTDHLNLTGSSPFDGGVFLDPRGVWDGNLVVAATTVTERSGTYAGVRGPEYQSTAESRYLALAGADVVGMSTVHEALTAAALDVRVGGLSVVSDLSLGAAPSHPQAILDAAAGSLDTLARATRLMLESP